MWLQLLRMLGRGQPLSGDAFTALNCGGYSGMTRTFVPKQSAGQVPGIIYFLRYIARLN